MYEITFTPTATAQLTSITNYITNELFNPSASVKLLEEIMKKIDILKEYPQLYPIVKDKNRKSNDVRRIIVNLFNVYYWINEKEKKIFIASVLYGKRDQTKQLHEMKISRS